MFSTITATPNPLTPTAHATINGKPCPVLIAARALGMSAEDVQQAIPSEALERLTGDLLLIEPLPTF